MKWRENGTFFSDTYFKFYECDNFGQARVSAILKCMNDFAGADYTDLGYNHKFLWDHDMVFLVSRVSMRISRPILADEPLVIATYERGTKGPLFYRDLYITDGDKNIAAASKTAWILCNPASRRILRPSSFIKEIPDNWGRDLDCDEIRKLAVPDDIRLVGERRINYSDLDSNGHVNNGVYADIAFDFLPHYLILKNRVRDFFINFQKEAKLGEIMRIYLWEKDERAIILGRLNDIVSFECEMLLEER